VSRLREYVDAGLFQTDREKVVSPALREIRIRDSVYQASLDRFGTQFGSVDKLVEFVLEELLRGDTMALDESEQLTIRARLRDLGYL